EFQGKKFSDYYKIEGGDVLPELHKLQKKTSSGLMYSLDYGGGTANIEFEALTSLTNLWTNTVPYTALLPKAGEVPSIASMLKKQNYSTSAIHPFNGGMYKRNIALKNEGFDEFTTELEMDYKEHEGDSEYINDQSAYKQTLKALKDSDENQVIGLITMQNHTPYNESTYKEHKFKVTGSKEIDEGRTQSIETYLQTLHESDKYLGEFIGELEKLDKKVVVLYFGDHSAGLFDITNDSNEKEVRDLSRVTPYFIWANYDAGLSASKKLPTTTPNCMVNTMLNRLQWKKDPLYYLLDDVCSTEPILAATYLDEDNFKLTETLQDYQLLTYDILGGERYWINNK
ncbi:MAG: LTA synthase family protein, partial [Candidatus Saccharibacteria bacterium]|nr:LTA synthase family protein [Candidatus Saccharibacteria bacterium]